MRDRTYAEKQREEIDALRKQWPVEEPELHKYPRWLSPAVTAAIRRGELPGNRYGAGGWFALTHATHYLGERWVDHAGRVKLADGTHLFVSEPYPMCNDAIRQLADFCSVLRLQAVISPISWWYPQHTIRIELRPRADISSGIKP